MKIIKEYLLPIALVILLLLLFFQKCQSDKEHANQIKKFDQTLTALTDSIKEIKLKDGSKAFTEKTVNMNLDELTNTEFFKQLSKERQKYYLDLQKTNNLLASSYELIRKQDSIIANLKYNSGTVSDTGVCYNWGDTLGIPQDTIDKMTYHGNITFTKKAPIFKLDYQYNVKIQSDFIRNKDGSINIIHKLDDPNARVIEGQSFMIPAEKPKKWMKPLKIVGGIVIVSTGGFIGYKVGQTFTK